MSHPHRSKPFGRTRDKLARALTLLLAVPWSALALPLPAHADDAPPAPAIIIEEVAWAGSSVSTADEWVELANIGSATTSIAGWSLRGASPQPIFLPDGTEIGPGETYRVANYAETDDKSALAVHVQTATTTMALSNSALGIQLVDAGGNIVDRAGDGHAPFAGSSSPHATMVRAATTAGDVADAWMTAQLSVGFKNSPVDGVGTAADFGAPGICELCREMGVADVTPPELPDEGQTITVDPSTSGDALPTTTTDPLPDPDALVTTSTSAASTQTSSTTVISQPVSSAIPYVSPPPPPLQFSLNEAMSNPAAGPEWVELKIAETGATSTDRALELWDKSGRFMTIPPHTAISSSGYLVLSLTSARLNNSGDDLSIREVPLNGSSGVVLELIHIPELEDGVAWAKRDDGTWSETEDITPGGPNRFSIAVITTTTISTTKTLSATSTSTSIMQTSATSTTYTGPPLHVSLNEAMSNPSSGKEWVELKIAEADATMTDRPYELWDGSGRIITIAAGTRRTSPGYLLATLPTSRLNNGGDSLSLREAGGDVTIDATDIPALAKGISWTRDETDGWTDCNTPTPGSPNIATSQKNTETSENKGSNDEPSTETSTPHSSTNADAPPSSLTPLNSSMSKDSPVNARVRLVGTVGSVPRLLGATHAFILLGEDGRAAIVYLPKHLNTPNFGSTVRVMGTLTATEQQLELRMKTTDVWLTIATSTPPQPRTIDFLAPAMEDAWGLASVTGTVETAGATSVVLNVDAVDITVSAPTAAGYRTKRLIPGDVVHVTGLLDPRKESPTILIRVADDITLTAHAPESVNPPSSAAPAPHGGSGLPDWIPFGAAGGAVVATGGFQRIRALLKRRKLEAMAGLTR